MTRKRIVNLIDNQSVSPHGSVIYWMSRDQRFQDNWALLHALNEAISRNAPLAVVFCLDTTYPDANRRHFAFMIDGLRHLKQSFADAGIPFNILHGNPVQRIPAFLHETGCSLLVTDFDPVRIKRQWKQAVLTAYPCSWHDVDTHNIVPVTTASDHQEYMARTIRPKLWRHIPLFLTDFPAYPTLKHPHTSAPDEGIPAWESSDYDTLPGEKAAHDTLETFLFEKLHRFGTFNNDPNADATSGLSPYLHFGHIAPQRVALTVSQADAPDADKEAFLEQFIIRRELTDNYCWYQPNYDSLLGAPDWAQKTLADHAGDMREYLYTYDQFLNAETHDPLWNAAQIQLTVSGTIHGYMRMYWGKKILEWTQTPEEALGFALRLNDTLALDGRDPNGYVGVLWSIAGLHDQAWKERPVYGKIRYMNASGCRRKFDVDAYVATWLGE